MNEKRIIVILVLAALIGFGFYTVSNFTPEKSDVTESGTSQNGILPTIANLIPFL